MMTVSFKPLEDTLRGEDTLFDNKYHDLRKINNFLDIELIHNVVLKSFNKLLSFREGK